MTARSYIAASPTVQFNLADYIQVKGANWDKGLLKIELVRKIPEAMKPWRYRCRLRDRRAPTEPGMWLMISRR